MRVEAVRRSAGQAVGRWIRDGLRVLRRISGMPDYEAYLEHLRQHHPDCSVPTEGEFFAQYTESRYGNGASRCC